MPVAGLRRHGVRPKRNTVEPPSETSKKGDERLLTNQSAKADTCRGSNSTPNQTPDVSTDVMKFFHSCLSLSVIILDHYLWL